MRREDSTAGSSCWCMTIVSCHSCQEAECPSGDSAVFFLCFPLLFWPPLDPQTLGRHAERFVSPAADFIIKILSPTWQPSKPVFRPRRMWEETPPALFYLSHSGQHHSQCWPSTHTQERVSWTMNTACFTIQGPDTDKKSYQHWIPFGKNNTCACCTFHRK